jgi:hypothetical protein
MAKIRGIKPEFWTDEDVVELTAHARLLYIGLWNYACDNGHLEDRPKQIKMRILPADDCSVADLLRELDEKGRITRREGWITIPNLTDHQRIDKRFFTTCDKPGCVKPGTESPDKPAKSANPERETRRAHDENTTSPQRDHDVPTSRPPGDCDGESDGEGDGDGELVPASTLDGPRKTLAVVADEVTAQTLVAEWIDHCAEPPPGRVKGQVAKELKALLNEGIDPHRIRAALAEWNRKGLHPSTLASVVHEIGNRKPQQRRGDIDWDAAFARAAARTEGAQP